MENNWNNENYLEEDRISKIINLKLKFQIPYY